MLNSRLGKRLTGSKTGGYLLVLDSRTKTVAVDDSDGIPLS